MEEIWMERWQLAVCRIREIAEDPETAGKPGDYFKKTAGFVLLVLEALKKAEADEFSHASLQELQDFYSGFLGIPVAGAALPVIAFFLLGIYGKVIWMLAAAVILGIGHIGIHLQHKRELNI